MDPELIAAIVALRDERWKHLNRIKQFGVDSVPDYLPKRVARIEQQLSVLRKYALFYRTYSTLENIEVLGEQYIRQMQRDLPPLVFQTSVLCRPVRLLKDGFYSSMKEEHLYTAANFNYLDALE